MAYVCWSELRDERGECRVDRVLLLCHENSKETHCLDHRELSNYRAHGGSSEMQKVQVPWARFSERFPTNLEPLQSKFVVVLYFIFHNMS